MPNYGGLGLVKGFANGLDALRAKLIQDKAQADQEKQQAFEDTLQQDQADREKQLFPAQLGLLKTQGTAAQQNVDLNKATMPDKIQNAHDEAKLAHNNAIASQINLNTAAWQRLHTSIYASARLMNDQVNNLIKSGGTQGVDPSIVEQAYNEGAPKGQRIKPGSLRIIPDATNPGATQIEYVRDDGQKRATTLAQWNQVAAAYVPPKQPVKVGKDDRLVDPTSGRVITDVSSGADVSSISPNGWASQVSSQIAKNYGGLIDAQGNLTGLNNDTARTVGDLAAVASAYGKTNGYNVPPPTVAAAVKYVHDTLGLDARDPQFMSALDRTVKQYTGTGTAGGIPASAPASTSFGLPNPLAQPSGGATSNTGGLIQQAKDAINAGKDPQAVRQRLQQLGVPSADIQAAGL